VSSVQVDPVARLLSCLDGVRKVGRGWMAKCPAHTDRSPSLSIAEGSGGVALLNCFHGCATADVMAALGLTLSDLYPERIPDQSPMARNARRESMRQAGLAAALGVLVREASVLEVAATMIEQGKPLTWDDIARVRLAACRIHDARDVLL
jgi:hypothetical protein